MCTFPSIGCVHRAMMVTHVRAHVCACGGWCIGVRAHPTFALGIFLQFSTLHIVQLGLSIKPRDCRLMILASQLSQESLSLFTGGCHTHPSLHRFWGSECWASYAVANALLAKSSPHTPAIGILTFKRHFSLAWLTPAA